MPTANGTTVTPSLTRHGIWDFTTPQIAIPMPTANGTTVTPSLTRHGIWDFTTPQLDAGLDGGLRIVGANGASFQLDGGYAGLFVPDFHSWNVSAHLTIPVQQRNTECPSE